MEFLRSQPGEEPVVVEGVFAASSHRVFKAWTNPEEVIAWFGPAPHSFESVEIDLRVGGQWRFVLKTNDTQRRYLEGEYLEVRPGEKLVFSWTFVHELASGERETTQASRVTVLFIDEGASTRIHLTHEAIQQRSGRLGVTKGWNTCFGQLRDALH